MKKFSPDSAKKSIAPPGWEPPVFEVHEFHPKRTRYCFCVITLNEGERIRAQLQCMRTRADLADVIIADGRSDDGSTEPRFLAGMGVRALLITDEPGLGTATRMGIAYALEQGYAGIVTVDGNGKDGVEALPEFLAQLDQGYDLVQGSRFIAGAFHQNTPLERRLAIQVIMSPLLYLGCGHFYSDPTNAFRAMSARFLADLRVQPLRRIFVRFNLQIYLICRAARLGFRLREVPVRRVYPAGGVIPTKIHGLRMKALILRELLSVILGFCDPKA